MKLWAIFTAGIASLLLGIITSSYLTSAYVTSFPDEPDIDGILITVGITIAKFLAGLVPFPTISALLLAIINAWEPKPEDNYWEHVRENVAQLCGEFINEHNLEQVEVYKRDLIGLLAMYERSEVNGDGTYPDKNVVADALTTSIITNRYLIEAAEMPWSMSVDFVDISSIHALILKDAAESYSTPEEVSRWWVDLSRELDHYIQYGVSLQDLTQTWRDDQIECYFDEASNACLDFEWARAECFDRYEIRDHVSNHVEDCLQLHPDNPEDGSCINFCKNYQIHIDQASQRWLYTNVGSVIQEMEVLKLLADEMASHASLYYNTYTKDK
ncbi:hypothetical protein SK128_026714 [Halocaridina rubra]|uniref:Uncharacterized protein n=1 Tax=Halocaridina rubra TaxID=373956 RepID=A0AAN8WE91_HALRR